MQYLYVFINFWFFLSNDQKLSEQQKKLWKSKKFFLKDEALLQRPRITFSNETLWCYVDREEHQSLQLVTISTLPKFFRINLD